MKAVSFGKVTPERSAGTDPRGPRPARTCMAIDLRQTEKLWERLRKQRWGKWPSVHIEQNSAGSPFALHAKSIPRGYRRKCQRPRRTAFKRLCSKMSQFLDRKGLSNRTHSTLRKDWMVTFEYIKNKSVCPSTHALEQRQTEATQREVFATVVPSKGILQSCPERTEDPVKGARRDQALHRGGTPHGE